MVTNTVVSHNRGQELSVKTSRRGPTGGMLEAVKSAKSPTEKDLEQLAKRMREVLRLKGWTEREWSRRAELPSESHVGTILERAEAGTGNGVSFLVLVRLANAADVSADWLMTGRGGPDGASVVLDATDPYESRARVLCVARVALFSDEAIAHVRSLSGYDADPGRDHFMAELIAAESRASAAKKLGKRKKLPKSG